MKKEARSAYVCQECGAEHPRWQGRCSGCGAWNTLEERKATAGKRSRSGPPKSTRLAEVQSMERPRLPSGLSELDRVLGGGVVPGGVVLLGGDPGIGKSTLALQMLGALAARRARTLYISGEESAFQVAERARRLGNAALQDIQLFASNDLEEVLQLLHSESAQAVVVDSIQTLRASSSLSSAGTVAQLREVTSRLTELAKAEDIALFLIGHVTKEGTIAGPKVLEHLVDTVLSFEGDATYQFRVLRATKNRFGPSQEVGFFEMDSRGLSEVSDPSHLFLAERPSAAAGSVVTPTANNSRPLMVEVQALVAPAASGGARRYVSGLDLGRLSILLAVLERRAGLHVLDQDVFASVAGGLRIDERSVDLALALAVVSSLRNRPIAAEWAVFGEVGLTGEVRAVPRAALRIAEARKLGFTRILAPASNLEALTPSDRQGLEITPARSIEQALEATLA